MNELSKEKMMYLHEVADILNVDIRTIQRYTKIFFPEAVRQGVATMLNEFQVTKIKLEMTKNYSIDSDSVVAVKTKLEKALLIQQAMTFQQEIIDEQQKEIDILKPKAIQYDSFMNGNGYQKIGDVAKLFNIKPNTLHKMLRDAKIMKDNYTPFSPYEKYFKTVESSTSMGSAVFTSYLRPEGISYVAKRFNLTEVK